MKKLTLLSIMIAAIMLISFTSCQKDGEYNPKKKISRIFYEEPGEGKYLGETFIWDKNLLSKIDFGEGDFLLFEYDKKRVSRVVSSDGGTMIKFTYDGSNYDKVEETSNYGWGGFSFTYHTVYKFSYKGNKIDKISVTETSTSTIPDFKGKIEKPNRKFNPMQLVLPELTCKSIANVQSKKIAKGTNSNTSTYTVFFTWKGNNVEKQVTEFIEEDGEIYTETFTATYDNKNNPFRGFPFMEEWGGGDTNSKNNVTKIVYVASDGDSGEIQYTYKYDKNFPTERIITLMGIDVVTVSYEYVK